MNKAIFLDRDGTINVEKHYLYKIEDFEFLPGTIEALKKLQAAGFLLIIVTNQSGIARGYYSEKDMLVLHNWMLKQFSKQGINISAIYYCPHLPNAPLPEYRKDCICRKPQLGMFMQAVEEFNIDLCQSYAIGDKLRDCSICFESECMGFLIGKNEADVILQNVQDEYYKNIWYASSLLDCANIITKNCEK